MMTILSEHPFKAAELPRVFWTIPAEVLSEGIQPAQVIAFGCIVELPNGLKAKCSRISFLGRSPAGGYDFMGFVSEMWDDIPKEARPAE